MIDHEPGKSSLFCKIEINDLISQKLKNIWRFMKPYVLRIESL